MTHTSTPWGVRDDPRSASKWIFDATHGTDICELWHGWHPSEMKEAEANAHLIVTAVNRHAAMIELLSECFDQLAGMDGQIELRARIMATLASVKESQA